MALEKSMYKKQVTVFTLGSDFSDIYLVCFKPSGSPLGLWSSFAGYQVVNRFARLCCQISSCSLWLPKKGFLWNASPLWRQQGFVEGPRTGARTGIYKVLPQPQSPTCKMRALNKIVRLIIVLMLWMMLLRNNWIISNILNFVAWRVWEIPVFTMRTKEMIIILRFFFCLFVCLFFSILKSF